MASSCTLLSRVPGTISRATVQPGKSAAAAAPRVLRKQSRARLFLCHAKHSYNIQPFALVHPKFPPTSHDNWTITEDADRINLWLFVERSTEKKDLVVATQNDVLLIKYTGNNNENPASDLDVRLLIPPGYDKSKVEAELAFGSLLVTVTKPSKPEMPIPFGDKPPTRPPPQQQQLQNN